MKVNSLDNSNISFSGFYNSKALKKALEFAENNGALFMSATSLALSALVRPISILSAPKTDKENKKIACAKSITSTILDFAITFAISLPIVRGMGAISKNPQKYLKQETIRNLQGASGTLTDSKAYTFASQMFKLGAGLVIAAPKALLNLEILPFITNLFFPKNDSIVRNTSEDINFRGKDGHNMSKLMGKIIDKKGIQEFSKKKSDTNFPMHITALKDAITTGTFITGVSASKKIDGKRKGPLIYNSLISTILCIASGYGIDSVMKRPAEKFINKLTEANKQDPKLQQYINGFKIAKPIVIMGIAYYLLIPLFSTFVAERIDKKYPIK